MAAELHQQATVTAPQEDGGLDEGEQGPVKTPN